MDQVTPSSLLRNPSAPGPGSDPRRLADVPLRPGTPSAALRRLVVASAATSPAQHDGRRTGTKPGTAGLHRCLPTPARLLAVVLVLASVGVSAVACGPGAAEQPLANMASVELQPRDLRVTVSQSGSLKARQQKLVRPRIPGQAKIMTLVEEGSLVKEGDVLCELDKTDLEKEIATLENRVIQLQGDVTAADAELAIQLSQNEADIADAALKLRFAKVELERFEKGEFVQESKRREVKVEESTSSLEQAKRKYAQMPALLAEGFVTASQVEEERIRELKANSELELAILDQSTYLTYTAPKELAQRQADVRNATLEVDRAAQRANAREAQRRSGVERQKSEMTNVQNTLSERTEVLGNMTLRAPNSGIVIYGDARKPWDDREIKVGEFVYSGQAFLTIPDLSAMQVVVAIHEADISRVKEGQKVFVTVETVRGRAIQGEVVKVARVAAQSGRRWSDRVKRFSVEIAISDDITGLDLKPGLTAQVEILVDELKDVLALPTQCVFAENGKFFVFQRSAAGAERVEVEIEDGNTSHVVVTSGLEAGARIMLYNPERTEGGAAAARPGAANDEKGSP